MKKKQRRLFASIFLAGGLVAASPAFAGGILTPKLQVRGSAGVLTNSGTNGGSAFSIGGFNTALSLYFSPDIAFYGGYAFQFEFKKGTLPLKGLFGGTRYHFLGEGTRVQRDQSNLSSTTRSRWSLYVGLELAQRAYYYQGIDSTGAPVNIDGSSLAFNGAVGAELRLSDHVDLNAEVNNTFLTFAASDPKYRLGGFFVHFGLGLLF